MKEDEYVNFLIRQRQSRNYDELDYEIEIEVHPEAHYNHYGNRGVADLFIIERYDRDEVSVSVYEVKGETAIKEATGANEILRQYNRMTKYFFKDESNRPWGDIFSCTFFLIFLPTETVIDHVHKNRYIYMNHERESPDSVARVQPKSLIKINGPDDRPPVNVNNPRHDSLEGSYQETLKTGEGYPRIEDYL